MSCANDDTVYAEINDTGAKKFSMDENVCYEGIKQRCRDLNNSAGNEQGNNSLALHISYSKKVFLLLFVLVIALLLGTVCACIVLALEISTLKSEMFSLQKETEQSQNATEMNIENLSQQQLSFAENQELNMNLGENIRQLSAAHQQLNMSLEEKFQQSSAANQQLSAANQQLNMSLEEKFQQSSAANQQLNAANQQLNISLEENIQQLSAANQQLSAASQQLNISLEENIQQLSAANQQLSAANQQLNMRLEENIQHLNASTQFLLDRSELITSCVALAPSATTGYYWVKTPNGSYIQVYCDMTRSCNGVTGGWMRVAELDMTNSSLQCPSGFRLRNDSNRRTCGISPHFGCSSVTFSGLGLQYSRVCGKIKAYQVGSTDGFYDGISITRASPREHIWTLASAYDEVGTDPVSNCPCIDNSSSMATPPPAFVGRDYFCDTGSEGRALNYNFYGDDPLWDGAGCGPRNTCCSLNNPPWFYKQLPQLTTDDIEMRACRTEAAEDIAIETVEIYIQ